MGEGSYRVLVNSDGETIIDVRKGSAEISTPQGSARVGRDQRITIQGNADNAQYQDFRRARPRRLGPLEQRPRSHDRKRAKLAAHQSLLHWHAGSGRGAASGRMSRTTAACGFLPLRPAGRRIAMAAGCTSPTTDGLGCLTSHGAGLRITTGVGSCMAEIGAGGPARLRWLLPGVGSGLRFILRIRRRRLGHSRLRNWLRRFRQASAGCLAVRATASSPGMAAESTESMSSTLTIFITTSAA